MRLEQITKIVESEGIRFIFYPEDALYRKNSIVYINVIVDSKERQEYKIKNENEQKEYVSKSVAIFLPDIDSERLGNVYINNDEMTYDFTLKKIRKIVSISKEHENLAFSLYLILHEIGHWYHFDEMGRKPYIYANEDTDVREEVFNRQQDLQKEMSLKKSFNKLTKNDLMTMKNWIIDYNNIPIEKRANSYADKNFKKMWDKL